MFKVNKALFLFGMLLLAAFASAQEAAETVQPEAQPQAQPGMGMGMGMMPNARRLNTVFKGGYYGFGGYYPYGFGGYPYGFGGYPYGFGFNRAFRYWG